MDWLTVIRLIFTAAIAAWPIAAMFILFGKKGIGPDNIGLRVARWTFHELKPFIRAMAVIRFGIHCLDLRPTLWIHAVILAMDLLNYHFYKDADNDDDRWKRRKQRVLDKVQVVSGQLVVTPT